MKCRLVRNGVEVALSLPVRGAWIEILIMKTVRISVESLPVRGAWIEITSYALYFAPGAVSLPVRGAWIEMVYPCPPRLPPRSLPVRGAWIEIFYGRTQSEALASLPVRGAWIEIYAPYASLT